MNDTPCNKINQKKTNNLTKKTKKPPKKPKKTQELANDVKQMVKY